MKEKFCKIHNQPYMVVCMRCAYEARQEKEEHPPKRFRDIANAE